MEVLAHISARATKDDDKKAIAQLQSYINFAPAKRVTISGRISKARIQKSSRAKMPSVRETLVQVRLSPKSTLERLELAREKWKAQHTHETESKAERANNNHSNNSKPLVCSNTQSGGLALSASFPREALETQADETNSHNDLNLKAVDAAVLKTSGEAKNAIATVVDHPESPNSTPNSTSNGSSRPNSPHSIQEISCKPQIDRDSFSESQTSHPTPTNLSSVSTCIKSPAPYEKLMQIEGTGTFMSQYLQRLISHKDLSRYYHPQFQVRKPLDSERGYWKFDMGSWLRPNQIELWAFLSDVISHGRAGIGTECVRGLDDGLSGTKSSSGSLRIYCWGELIMPIYLLCYIGSGGLLKKELACWISAIDGQPLMQIN
jgi:hypothetical protein